MKSHYRTFNIKGEDLTPGDDYGMMREVLRPPLHPAPEGERAWRPRGPPIYRRKPWTAPPRPRRESFPQKPDLILIDGGPGQFEAAHMIFAELGVRGVTIASIAKGADRNAGRETFYVDGREPFRLSPRDPALLFRAAPAR